MEKEAINKKVWQEGYTQTYAKIPPPFVPSKKHIVACAKILKNIKKKSGNKALVLGCTPAIRDCLAKMKFKVTLLEFSQNMVETMNDLRKIESKEKIINGLWTEATKYFLPKTFDCIIGHAVTNNLVNLGLYEQFFKAMKTILKPGGELIITVTNASPILQTAESVIEKCKRQPSYFKSLNNKIYIWESCAYSDQRFYNKKECTTEMNKFNLFLGEKLKNKEITQKEYDLMTFDFYDQPHRVTMLPEKMFDRIVKKYFTIVKKIKEPVKHPAFSKFYTIYQLRKK